MNPCKKQASVRDEMKERGRPVRMIGSLVVLAVVAAQVFGCGQDTISPDDPAARTPINNGCPADLPGPAMVALPTPTGGTYCMDSTEVTQGQYLNFVHKVTGTTEPTELHRSPAFRRGPSPFLNSARETRG